MTMAARLEQAASRIAPVAIEEAFVANAEYVFRTRFDARGRRIFSPLKADPETSPDREIAFNHPRRGAKYALEC
jgi:hypothetical protein